MADQLTQAVSTKKFTKQEEIEDIYLWIRSIPLSRPKKQINRDFSDGVLIGEVVAHFLPGLINLNEFFLAHSSPNKAINWNHLNQKVLSKIGVKLSKRVIEDAIQSKNGAIEKILIEIRPKLAERNKNVYAYRNLPTDASSTTSIPSLNRKKVVRQSQSQEPTFPKIELQLEETALNEEKLQNICDCTSSETICELEEADLISDEQLQNICHFTSSETICEYAGEDIAITAALEATFPISTCGYSDEKIDEKQESLCLQSWLGFGEPEIFIHDIVASEHCLNSGLV